MTSKELAYALWEWVVNANNGCGGDVDDLILILDDHNITCPDELVT